MLGITFFLVPYGCKPQECWVCFFCFHFYFYVICNQFNLFKCTWILMMMVNLEVLSFTFFFVYIIPISVFACVCVCLFDRWYEQWQQKKQGIIRYYDDYCYRWCLDPIFTHFYNSNQSNLHEYRFDRYYMLHFSFFFCSFHMS